MRGEDLAQRPQVTREHIMKHSNINNNLLDIGCGSAHKTAFYIPYFSKVFGLEPSHDLRETAKTRLKQGSSGKMHLIGGLAENLPFKAGHFNLVSSVLAWWDAAEVARVLKPNGIFIMERLGLDDKTAFTKLFGEDEQGLRGAGLNSTLNEVLMGIRARLSPYFKQVEFFDSRWETAYTAEGLWTLLNNTKTTVRNFNLEKDRNLFNNAIKKLEKNGKIVLMQNRLTLVAHAKNQ